MPRASRWIHSSAYRHEVFKKQRFGKEAAALVNAARFALDSLKPAYRHECVQKATLFGKEVSRARECRALRAGFTQASYRHEVFKKQRFLGKKLAALVNAARFALDSLASISP